MHGSPPPEVLQADTHLSVHAAKQLYSSSRWLVMSVVVLQAYEEQLGQARAIQAQLQLCEEELEARTQDLTRYAAENRNIEVCPCLPFFQPR